MKIRPEIKDVPFLLLNFFLPLMIFYFTSSSSLMFDDAGEFALVISLGSIAHPPGTPAFILGGMIWKSMTDLFSVNTITSLTFFASLCVSLSSLLIYFIFKMIATSLQRYDNYKGRIICSLCSLVFITAATTWSWANTIEVYSFQVFVFTIALFGLTGYHFQRRKIFLFIAAIGIASGLGGHHLTMIMFLPFVPLFFLKVLFVPKLPEAGKKKNKQSGEKFIAQLVTIFSEKNFWLLTGLTFTFTVFYYGWMFLRAQQEYSFMFGGPSTLSELYFHVSGGTYTKNISETSSKIISSRIPYFLKLTAMQVFIFIPVMIAGIIIMLRKKLFRLFWMILLYFLFLFIYQLNNNQWSSTDAYMLLPFMMLNFFVFYGALFYLDKFKMQFVMPVLLVIQIIYNYPLHDRHSYPVSKSLMELMDKSAPKNSIVIISDWSLLIQYYYYRIVENFRPDLVVLNYDMKFTHYRILPIMYPDFYNDIKTEYDQFVDELRKEHPHQVINTGCDLNTPELNRKFKSLLLKIENTARTQDKFLLTDPRSHYFYSTNNFYDSRRYVSGCFSSSRPGVNAANDNFVALDFPFLKSKLLFQDPAALDKLVDFQAMLDRHLEFYTANNDLARIENTKASREKVFRFQREMKKSMSFAYKN